MTNTAAEGGVKRWRKVVVAPATATVATVLGLVREEDLAGLRKTMQP